MFALIKKYWFLLSLFGLIYCGLAMGLRTGQTRLMFFPSSIIRQTPKAVNLSYEEVWISMDNGKLHGWWIDGNCANCQKVLYFHGNSSNLGDLLDKALFFHRLGVSILFIDYRGYGKSQGKFPNEIQLYEDAEASWLYLTQEQKISPHNIIVYGHSLGSAIAIELGTRYPKMGGLILESPFTSMSAMVDYVLPWQLFPKSLILTQKFDSLFKIATLKIPILIIHGKADKTIPYTMSQELYKKAMGTKSLVLFEKVGHTDIQRRENTKYRQLIRDWFFFRQK